jgi:hypothetical protein
VFFVSSDTQPASLVKCPSCQQALRVPGAPQKGEVRSNVSGGFSLSGPNRTMVLAAGGAAIAIVIVIFAGVMFLGTGRRPDDIDKYKLDPYAETNAKNRPVGGGGGPLNIASKEKSEPSELPTPPKTTDTKPPDQDPLATPKGDAIPMEIIVRVKARVFTLPPYYLDRVMTPADRVRASTLVEAGGKGTSTDAAWLHELSNAPLVDAAHAEVKLIANALPELEQNAFTDLPPDKLFLNDGRTIECQIMEDTATEVRIERRIAGGTSKMTFPRDQVREVGKGKGIRGEAEQRLQKARAGGSMEMSSFAAWCKEQNLGGLKALACHLVLKADPGNAFARSELALPEFGAAAKTTDPVAEGPMVTWNEKQWPARQLKERLIKDGYVVINGLWHARKDKILSIPGLPKYERQEKRQLEFSGELASNYTISYKPKYEPTSKSWSEEEVRTSTLRFVAPLMQVNTSESTKVGVEKDLITKKDEGVPKDGKAMTSEVMIPIHSDLPIIEAKIRAVIEVDNGQVICTVTTAAGRQEVFRAASKEDRTHKLPDSVRGATDITIALSVTTVADYETKTDRRKIAPLKKDGGRVIQKEVEVMHERMIPRYGVRIFPSTSNTMEVFRATLVVGEPSIGLNKAFEAAGAMDVLRD